MQFLTRTKGKVSKILEKCQTKLIGAILNSSLTPAKSPFAYSPYDFTFPVSIAGKFKIYLICRHVGGVSYDSDLIALETTSASDTISDLTLRVTAAASVHFNKAKGHIS